MYNALYYLKKRFALYPGGRRAVSAAFLADHYVARTERRSAPRATIDMLVGGLFRLWVPLRARRVAGRFGLDRAWADRATRIARQRFADPNDLALFRIAEAGQMDFYMRRFEHAAINKAINPRGWEADCALADKVRFAARCARHAVAHPALFATASDGRIDVRTPPAGPALVIKPAAGEGGSGVRMVDYPDWRRADAKAFAACLAPLVRGLPGTWLVQQRIANHPDLSDIAINALATVRVTTMLNEAGEPEIVTSVLRFPSTAESLVDNIKAGGLMAPVDAETGTLGAACRGRGAGEFETHPVSGGAVAGRMLPDWPAAVALALRAHREAFADYNLVGWDVALTADGPMMLEGNGKPCLIVAQRASRKGVGETRFGELVAHHLAHARLK